ncbi:MAG TPA: guanylate kinase, partial [Erysipelotrichaceae bacterium]|nr:guanylate kinase [Erysipelotrichaceae bacterium]
PQLAADMISTIIKRHMEIDE